MCVCVCVLATQSCPTHCDPMDCSPPGFSVHGISQARILEHVAISFYWGFSRPRDPTSVSCNAGRFFTTEPPAKPTVKIIKRFSLLLDHYYLKCISCCWQWPLVSSFTEYIEDQERTAKEESDQFCFYILWFSFYDFLFAYLILLERMRMFSSLNGLSSLVSIACSFWLGKYWPKPSDV